MTTFSKDENNIINIGGYCFFDLSTLHGVAKDGMKLRVYFCNNMMILEWPDEKDTQHVFEYLMKTKSDYMHACRLEKEASERRQSLAAQTGAEILKEMRR